MAPDADVMMGTRARGVNLVIPQTRKPKKTFPMQTVKRIDQLSSKNSGTVVVVDIFRWPFRAAKE